MAAVTRSRLLNLTKAQCEIFATTYNPDGIRMGNLILRQRLRGPTLAKYYPPRGPTINTLERAFKGLGLETINEQEEDRLEHLAGVKSRGKGAPKKIRTPKGKGRFDKKKK
ncbi:mitochondrial ribosomal subunit S27-domain-containing protein [Annulohypoxylon maeteangense]|uniref:mitochondrial ribosomal subunit S27-domain-containing protein n=1 Tax=Annulohypoxylon maeteangense TaxID=1927788 RepID=UPI002008063C|nr:mitochondrial ribosomal subunit S27-domain-containing protein [Annulohypoxylon maeteangense]KAI0884790.1 mitochondrial ribosomal subunit S27-domain-containing protein [Annulohypoxylon maeteangense]